jgi:cell division protein FtsZ
MAIHLSAPRATELKPRIVVFGVGGAGGNAVNNMIEAGLEGVEFVVANTDAQQLQFSKTDRRIQLGAQVTQGLGAGAHPEVGMSAAEESFAEISEHLEGAHMVFITAGMGGGTGTGAAPIIAKAARERGILTVGVVTKPFHFEGRHRMRLSDAGVAELQRYVDTLIVIPNQNLFRVANERTTFAEAFAMADQVLHSGVRSITDLMVMPGLINLDFADVRSVMTEMGKAMMGTGEAAGEDRALMASQNAIANPLLDEVSLKGARAVLVNVTGGLDMTLLEVDEAANAISSEVDPDANIIFGAAFDPALEGRMRVSVVATGMDAAAVVQPETIGRFQTARPASQPTATTAPAPAQAPARATAAAPAAGSRYARTPEPASKAEPKIEATVWPEPARAPEPARTEALDFRAAEAQLRAAEPRAPEPRIAAAETPPVIRIVDPSVEEDDGTAFGGGLGRSGYDARRAAPAPLNNEPRQKGGWLSLFGGSRPRDEAPLGHSRGPAPAVARSAAGGSAQPAPQPAEPQDSADDLEIPSFLRRLAN